MGTFSSFIGNNEAYYESVLPDVDAESLLEDTSIEPCFEENFAVAAARVCAENTANMNAIMQACAIQEFAYFEETGEQLVYEASTSDGFFSKIRAFFMKLWEKIQGIFKKAIMMFNTKFRSDKEFFNKYKKEINSASNSSFGDKEIPIYTYIWYKNLAATDAVFTDLSMDLRNIKSNSTTISLNDIDDLGIIADTPEQAAIDIVAGCKDLFAALKKNGASDEDIRKNEQELDDIMRDVSDSDWKNDCYDKFRGKIVKRINSTMNSSEVTAKEFGAEIAEACQNDTSKDDVALGTAVGYAAAFLENSKKSCIDPLDKGLKTWKREIDTIIKSTQRLQKAFSKEMTKGRGPEYRIAGYAHTLVSNFIQVCQGAKNIGITAHGYVIQQLKACSAQSRSICVQAVHYKKPKNESTVYQEESTGSLLDSIDLI